MALIKRPSYMGGSVKTAPKPPVSSSAMPAETASANPFSQSVTAQPEEKGIFSSLAKKTAQVALGPFGLLADKESRDRLTGFASAVVKPVAQTVVQMPKTFASGVADLAGDVGISGAREAAANLKKPTQVPGLGEVKGLSAVPGDAERFGTQTAGQTAGQALEMAASVLPAGGASTASKIGMGTLAGGMAGAGQALGDKDATAKDVLSSAALGAGTGLAFSAAAPVAKAVKDKVASWLPTAEKSLIKAIKPGKNNINFKRDLGTAMEELHDVAPKIDSLQSLDTAIKAKKTQIWGEVKDQVESAGKELQVDMKDAAAEVRKIASRPLFKIKNSATAEKLTALADSLDGKKLSVAEAEDVLEELNAAERAYYNKNASSRALAEKADPELAADLALADSLRRNLDSLLEGFGDLKKRYGALANVGKEVSGRIPVAERANMVSLGEQISAARTAGNVAGSALTGNWGNAAGQIFDIGTAKLVKHLNDSDTQILMAFKKLSQSKATKAASALPKSVKNVLKKTAIMSAVDAQNQKPTP